MYFDSKGDYWPAMEIMVGKRVGSREPEGSLLEAMTLIRAFEDDPKRIRKFYEGFAHTYNPTDENK